MKTIQIPGLLCMFILLAASCTRTAHPGTDQPVADGRSLLELIQDPPSSYRSAPLWDWNEKITREDIEFQMNRFHEQGLGGVFVHPRPGLVTEYLSDDWHELFRFTVDVAKRLGMKVWIYDENSYPSGFAGGHVAARHPDSYRNGTGLGVKITGDLADTAGLVVESIIEKPSPDEGSGLLTYYIFYRTYPNASWWTGGYPYVDLLYPGVADTFLRITMEGYEKYSGSEFGTTMPGVFTDEPNLPAAKGPGTILRWTPDLFERFEERWGYRLEPHLDAFIEETGEWRQVRHNYHVLLLELFLDRWFIPWFDYTEDKGLLWTGHYWEHGWPYPTEGIDELAFYMYHQMPGVDMLGRSYCSDGLCQQFGNTRAIRELASAANQRGWIRRLSETYGGAGWQISFEELKRLADWQGVLGVNFVNQHLSYYSMLGVRKFDYPPSFSYQEPWWTNYRIMGDYLGRISLAMSAGEQINEVMVLQPNTSAWMYYTDRYHDPRIMELSKSFKAFVQFLEESHCEYDLGSEQVMQRFGKVTAKGLNILARTYSSLVIPAAMTNMDEAALTLIEQFLEAGHPVYCLSDSLDFIEGKASDRIRQLAARHPNLWKRLDASANEQIIAIFENQDCIIRQEPEAGGQLFHQRRILSDGQLLFLVNSSLDESASASISMRGRQLVEIDLLTGLPTAPPFETTGKMVTFDTDLPPAGSRLFLVNEKINRDIPAESNAGLLEMPEVKILPGPVTTVSRLSPNVLTLDYLSLETADFKLDEVYFMKAMYRLFEWSKLPTGNPWQHKIQYRQQYLGMDQFGDSTWFRVSYRFFVDESCEENLLNDISVVVERAHLWKVLLNGGELHAGEGKWWLDRHFPVFATGGKVVKGWNSIELAAPKMSVFAEIMPVYLLGDFSLQAADKGFILVKSVAPGEESWKNAGMPFYGDQVGYSQSFVLDEIEGRYEVVLGGWKGTVAEVWVNNHKAGILGWQPFRLDVTDHLIKGENSIEVRITGSLKNTLGYHHVVQSGWIDSPWSWNQGPDQQPPGEAYQFLEYGLYGGFTLEQIVSR